MFLKIAGNGKGFYGGYGLLHLKFLLKSQKKTISFFLKLQKIKTRWFFGEEPKLKIALNIAFCKGFMPKRRETPKKQQKPPKLLFQKENHQSLSNII